MPGFGAFHPGAGRAALAQQALGKGKEAVKNVVDKV